VLWDRTMFIEHVNESTCGRPTVFIPYLCENGLLSTFYAHNVIILPRQARDKHREDTQKKGRSLRFGGLGSGRMPFGHSGDIVTSWCEKRLVLSVFTYKMHHFAKTGSGQT
jgi:hypothetical protein